MAIVIYLAPLVMLIGLIMFFAVKNSPDLKEVGKLMFFCGLLASLLLFGSGQAFKLP